MRVNSGKWKGRLLNVPKGTRPTTDRVKEAVFSIIGPVQNFRILDLYAGSGSLGIEALSRGASSVVFVEKSRQALKLLSANIPEPAEDDCELVLEDVFSYLNRTDVSFNLVFCDPPYNKVDYGMLVEAFDRSAAIGTDTLVMLEADRFHEFPCPAGLILYDKRRFGDNLIYFYRRK